VSAFTLFLVALEFPKFQEQEYKLNAFFNILKCTYSYAFLFHRQIILLFSICESINFPIHIKISHKIYFQLFLCFNLFIHLIPIDSFLFPFLVFMDEISGKKAKTVYIFAEALPPKDNAIS
jgi:hypothetical protein